MKIERSDSIRLSRRDTLRIGGGVALASALPWERAAAQDATPAAIDGMSPSPMEGVPNAYWKYPTPFRTVDEVPGNGGKVKVLVWSDKRVSVDSSNQYLQELAKRLGVELELTVVPGSAYAERIATMMAGGDFPDLMHVFTLLSPQQPEFMVQGAYADLTDHLDGDARQTYPNLAAFPSYAWENSKLNGRLYGVPSPTALQANALWYRNDWATKLSLAAPTNAKEFLDLTKAFTQGDPDGNGSADTYGDSFERLNAFERRFVNAMFRVPALTDGWRLNADGTFTNAIETDEFRQSVEFMREMWAAGVCHPDSVTQTSNEVREQLMAGSVGAGANAFILLGLIRTEAAKITPTAEIMGLLPPGHDGGAATTYNIAGYFGLFSIPSKVAGDQARVEELLRITNYFGAPFGSEEYTFLNYGIEGVHHTVNDDGSRVLTQLGEAEIVSPSLGGLNVLYDANEERIRYVQSLLAQQVAIGITEPTLPLYSPTYAANSGDLTQFYYDRLIDIGTGRDGIDALDQWIADWKSRGGDTIRREFEEAYAASH